MLTADLIRGTVRSGRLHVTALKGQRRRDALALAETYCALIGAMEGVSRDEVVEALRSIETPPRFRKTALGLQKLLLDECEFLMPEGPEPRALRRALFRRAAQLREASPDDARFDRDAVVREVAARFELSTEQLESSLYADLKGTHTLVRAARESPDELLSRYELAQQQAVLLRATRVEVRLRSPSPDAMRALLRACKFRRLLWSVSRDGEEWLLTLDGPMSLLRSSTRYGLQLALLLPAIRAMGRFSLQADVRWGRQRRPLVWTLESKSKQTEVPWRVPDDVSRLLQEIERLKTPWRAAVADDLLELPGVGWCVPDLALTHPGHGRVLVEVMGHWSREAVWRRVELAQRGLATPILFAVSERLRVDASVLPLETSAGLIVYKGVIHARQVLELAAKITSEQEPS